MVIISVVPSKCNIVGHGGMRKVCRLRGRVSREASFSPPTKDACTPYMLNLNLAPNIRVHDEFELYRMTNDVSPDLVQRRDREGGREVGRSCKGEGLKTPRYP